MIFLIVCLIILILISGSLSGAETAFFSLSSMKVRAFKQGKSTRGQTIARLLSRPQELLVTILMLNVLVNILVQNVVSGIFGDFSGYLYTVGIPLALTLIFGEIIPKSLAISKNETITRFMAPIISGIERVLRPLRDLIVKLTAPVSRILFFYLKKGEPISSKELKLSLKASKEYGVLSDEEAKIVKGYLNLDDLVVKEVMTPRQEILAYYEHEPLSRLVELFDDKEISRMPICRGSIEETMGILSAEDFFLHSNHIKKPEDLLRFAEKVNYIPESMELKPLLRKMYREDEEMVLVVDEYGSITGLLTLEDLVEVIVGQITDRRDEKSRFTQSSQDVIICSGKLELTAFEEIYDVMLESPNNMATLGGWLTEQMGDIPRSGSKYVTEDFLFHILASDINRVRRIYVRKLKGRSK